jgi:hypothetical protein
VICARLSDFIPAFGDIHRNPSRLVLAEQLGGLSLQSPLGPMTKLFDLLHRCCSVDQKFSATMQWAGPSRNRRAARGLKLALEASAVFEV